MKSKNVPNLLRKVAALLWCTLCMACSSPAPEEEFISVSPSQLSFAWQKGSQQTVTIQSSTNWVMEGPNGRISWLSATVTSGMKGTTVVTFTTLQDNPVDEPRSETIYITGGETSATITVTQEPHEIDYFITVNPQELVFANIEASQEVMVNTNDEWTASSDGDWCTVKKSGSNSMSVSVGEYTEPNTRTATITITGTKGKKIVTMQVKQRGTNILDIDDFDETVTDLDPLYYFDATPMMLYFEATPSRQELRVLGNDEWTVRVDDDWCHLMKSEHTIGDSGWNPVQELTGNGETVIYVEVDNNPMPYTRKTTLTLSGKNTGRTITMFHKKECLLLHLRTTTQILTLTILKLSGCLHQVCNLKPLVLRST